MEAKRSPQRRSSLQTPRWAKATVTGVCAHGDRGHLRAGPLRPTPPDSESGAGRPDPVHRPGPGLGPWCGCRGAVRAAWRRPGPGAGLGAHVWGPPRLGDCSRVDSTCYKPRARVPVHHPTLLSRRQPHPAVSPRETSLRLCLQTGPSAGAEQRAVCLPPPPRSVASPEATEDSLSIWPISITHLGIRALNLI